MTKIEVGKKYRSRLTGRRYACVGTDLGGRALLQSLQNIDVASSPIYKAYTPEDYVEFKEPLSYDKWHLIYQRKNGDIFLSSTTFPTEVAAKYHGNKAGTTLKSVGTIRVSWVEEEH